MRLDEYLKSEATKVEYCTARHRCPIGKICGVTSHDGRTPLFPTIIEVEKGDMLWTDLRFEPRVFVVRKGIFTCIAHGDCEIELPFSLLGKGIAIGMAELYIPREASSTYYLKALLPGEVCSLPAKPLQRAVEAQPYPYSQVVLSATLTNQVSCSLTQAKIVSRPALRDRIILLLLCLKRLAAQSGGEGDSFAITHEDVASLVASDRVSTTRVLHKIRDEGLIELGYKSIKLLPAIDKVHDLAQDAESVFYTVDDLLAGAKGADGMGA